VTDAPDRHCESPRVSVIVPNWNGSAIIGDCLESIRAQTYGNVDRIVVDDGSTDDSVDLIARGFPDFRLIALGENRGFAHAVNVGMRAALGDIFALLNSDARADPRWVEELVAALSRHPDAGSAASKILLDGPDCRIHSAGDVFLRAGVPDSRGVWEVDRGQYDDEQFVFGACGGAAGYRRTMIEEIGPFDEQFGMYCEDVDLAFRAQLRGYRCVYAPRALVRHRLGASTPSDVASYLCGRNFVWLLARDAPEEWWRRHWAKFLRTQLALAIRALRHAREPAARARLRGQLHGLATVPRLVGQRGSVQRPRRVTSEQLSGLLTQ